MIKFEYGRLEIRRECLIRSSKGLVDLVLGEDHHLGVRQAGDWWERAVDKGVGRKWRWF